MVQTRIDRINALAKKAKAEGLTQEETLERDALRKEYIAAFRASLTSNLDNVYVLDENGNEQKLKRKEKEGGSSS